MPEIPKEWVDRIICGDALEVLKTLPDESIQMSMCSPPYYGLRDYKVDKQIGLEPTFELYLKHLLEIFDEIKRVLKKDGVVFVNLGDTYGGNKIGKTDKKVSEYLKEQQIGIVKKVPGFEKSLLMIPERFALGMIERGWILRNRICWFKRNAMPSSVKDRFTCTWEYVYFFSKSRRYYFNLDAIRQPLKTVTLERYDRNYGSPDNKYNNQDPKLVGGAKIDLRPKEYKFNYRVRDAEKKKDQCPQFKASEEEIKNYRNKTVDQSYKISGIRPCPEPNDPKYHLNKYFYKQNNDWLCKACHTSISKHKQGFKNRNQNIGAMISDTGFYYENSLIKWCNPLGKNPGDHWDITTKGFKGAHFAVYPEELCLMPIKASSKPGDIVLDCFAGAGTTCLVAKKLQRNYIGIDLNPDYVKMAEDRILKECGRLF